MVGSLIQALLPVPVPYAGVSRVRGGRRAAAMCASHTSGLGSACVSIDASLRQAFNAPY